MVIYALRQIIWVAEVQGVGLRWREWGPGSAAQGEEAAAEPGPL